MIFRYTHTHTRVQRERHQRRKSILKTGNVKICIHLSKLTINWTCQEPVRWTDVMRLCVIVAWLTMLLFFLMRFIGSLLFYDPHLCTTFCPERASISLYSLPSLSLFLSSVISLSFFFYLELERASCLTIGGTPQSEVSRSLISLYLCCMHR